MERGGGGEGWERSTKVWWKLGGGVRAICTAGVEGRETVAGLGGRGSREGGIL